MVRMPKDWQHRPVVHEVLSCVNPPFPLPFWRSARWGEQVNPANPPKLKPLLYAEIRSVMVAG